MINFNKFYLINNYINLLENKLKYILDKYRDIGIKIDPI